VIGLAMDGAQYRWPVSPLPTNRLWTKRHIFTRPFRWTLNGKRHHPVLIHLEDNEAERGPRWTMPSAAPISAKRNFVPAVKGYKDRGEP